MRGIVSPESRLGGVIQCRLARVFVDQRLRELPARAAAGADTEFFGELLDIVDAARHGLANFGVPDGLA